MVILNNRKRKIKKQQKKSYTNEKLSLRTKHFKFSTLSSEKRIKGFDLNVF